MPFDARRPPCPPLLYLLPASTARDTVEEGLLTAEVAALRQAGRVVIPCAITSDPVGNEPALAAEMIRIGLQPGAAVHPIGLARAIGLALRQTTHRRRDALMLGRRVAATATRHGCGAIHVASADAAAIAGLIGGRLARLPVSLSPRACDVYAAPRDMALKLAAAGLVLAPCRAIAEACRAVSPHATIRIVPQGIDMTHHSAADHLPRNGRLLCLAPLLPRSGLEDVIGALVLLSPAHRPVIDVIGAGPLLESLRDAALEAGISDHLRFLGARGPDWVTAEAPRYLGLVAPGIVAPDGDCDPQPIAVLRAMALQLPVLATGLPGMRDLVRPDCGLLVNPAAPSALAAGLHWLANLPEDQRSRLGEAGRNRVLHRFTTANRATVLAAMLSAGRQTGTIPQPGIATSMP